MGLNQAEAPKTIGNKAPSTISASHNAALPRCFPLSHSQRDLWRRQGELERADRNVARAFRLTGPLDMSALRWSLREIGRRHPILRAAIVLQDGQPTDSIDDSVALVPVVTELSETRSADTSNPGPSVAGRRG